jgi:hypothetical protein
VASDPVLPSIESGRRTGVSRSAQRPSFSSRSLVNLFHALKKEELIGQVHRENYGIRLNRIPAGTLSIDETCGGMGKFFNFSILP